MRGLFVTGTDTGVGKTRIACAIVRSLRESGIVVAVSKPIATGANRVDDHFVSEDTRLLAEAAGQYDLQRITPWSFPEPVAPPIAGRLHGVSWTIPDIGDAVKRSTTDDRFIVVEGIGGLLCPLTEKSTIAELINYLRLPVLVVASASLGTLNHTLLTLEAAASRCLRVVGVVVNHTSAPFGLAEQTAAAELRSRIRVPMLAEVGFEPHNSFPDAIRDVAWEQLIDSHA